ncbi:MAG: 3-dehydroquinate synthase [Actinomycetota bacterium]
MRRVEVSLGDRSYEVVVGAGLIDSVLEFVPGHRYSKVALVADEMAHGLYGKRLEAALAPLGPVYRLLVPSSEKAKSWEMAGQLLEGMARLKLRRDDLVMSFGGGVASDLGGFLASVYQRGTAVAHVSTTLLGQVDAAIGGKTGVNLPAGKNLVGTFYQPKVVVADVGTLSTLPVRQFRSGMAEVVKYGLCYEPRILSIVAEQMQEVEAYDLDLLEELVALCAGIKAQVVSGDESDRSGRIMLNYGHTFGHALEVAGGYERWLHGEAISVGMMFAAHLALEMGLLDPPEVEEHRAAFERAGLPVRASFDPVQVAGAWAMDKKFLGGQRWVLLDGLQNPVVRSDVTPTHIDAAIDSVLAP